jgi:adenylate cyclase
VQQGKIEEAVRWYEKASEVRPEDYQSLLLATSLLRRLGDKEKMERFTNEGQKRAMRQLEVNPDDARAAYLTAATMVNVGRTDEALRLAERALAIDPNDSVTLYNVACLHSIMGDTDKALDILERAGPGQALNRDWWENDPDLDNVRDHPRFVQLLEGISRSG